MVDTSLYERQRHDINGPTPESEAAVPPAPDLSPYDFQVCQACGRASRSTEGHDKIAWCYGCGARFMGAHKGPHDPFAAFFGPYVRVSVTNKIAVDCPGDYRYDPWTGEPCDAGDLSGRQLCAAQLEQLAKVRAACASR